MQSIEYHEPATVEEVTTLLADYGYDAKVIAGGTAVVLMMKQDLLLLSHLVNLQRLPKMDYIEYEAGTGLRLGALVTLRDIERSALVRERYPALAGTCGEVANIRIRNAATLGGNLCEADYASDPPALLTTLGAEVKAVSSAGERVIPLESFFQGYYETILAPDEILTEIRVPEPQLGMRATYFKYISRSSEDRPCVGVAAAGQLDEDGTCADLRIAVGAVAPIPQRIPDADALAHGEQLSDELIHEIADQYAQKIEPISDLRGSEWYRRRMVRVFVWRALQKIREGGGVVRVQ